MYVYFSIYCRPERDTETTTLFPLGEGYHNYFPNTNTLMSKVSLFLEFKLLMQLTFLSTNNKINGKNIIIKRMVS